MRHPTLPSASRKHLLQARAHGLRRAPTLSEAKLWAELSGGKLGVAFRRQVPVGHRYIVDFLAPALKLVVEVDGSVHAKRRAADARRDEWLRRSGFRVVRCTVEEVAATWARWLRGCVQWERARRVASSHGADQALNV